MVVIILPASFGNAGEDKQPPKPDTPQPPLIRLAAQATAKPSTALRYRLLPDPLDMTPGNAAPLWLQAVLAERGKAQKIEMEEYKWSDRSEMPLKNLPRPTIKAFLARHATALRLARQAAHREYCDWQRPALTFQNMQDNFSLPGVQGLREIAFLLSVECRYQIAEQCFDEAIETLQTGLALARHVGQGDTLIQSLVGIAIAHIMLGRIEEWMQIPGSPNLYWPLTALPQPLLDVRHSTEHEMNDIYRLFPQLRELQKETLSTGEVDRLIGKLFRALDAFAGSKDRGAPTVTRKLGIAILTAKVYPEARKQLLEQGRPAKEVDAMPMAQVALMYFLNDYDRIRDGMLKWMTLPSWQALPGLVTAEKDARTASRKIGNPLVSVMMPALGKIFIAKVRLELNIASLRGGEALRLHAAAHEGQPPAKWSDLTIVPLPLDPYTGKGFDTYYQVKDGRALLIVPPPPGQSPLLSRRFELAASR